MQAQHFSDVFVVLDDQDLLRHFALFHESAEPRAGSDGPTPAPRESSQIV
jgi:hypothetical protein